MSASVVLVDRDPLYAWFVTEALHASGLSVTWFRDAGSALASAATIAEPALLLVDGATWLSGPRRAAAAIWPHALIVGWDVAAPPPAGFRVRDDKPGDAHTLQAAVAEALAAARPVETSAPRAG
jgi:hypothetical protein